MENSAVLACLGHLEDSFVEVRFYSSEPCAQIKLSITGTKKTCNLLSSWSIPMAVEENALQEANPQLGRQRLSSCTAGGKTPDCRPQIAVCSGPEAGGDAYPHSGLQAQTLCNPGCTHTGRSPPCSCIAHESRGDGAGIRQYLWAKQHRESGIHHLHQRR